MQKSNPSKKEVVGDQLTEETSKLECFALGEGATVCEACGGKLREGAPLVVFAFRPADEPAFEIGHVKCVECRHEPTEYFTLGVRELVLDGRVGTCSDPATQSSWPVLLAPQARAVSPADATTVRPLPGAAWFRHPARGDVFAAAGRASTRKPWQRPVVRADNTNRNSTLEPERESKSDDTAATTAGSDPVRTAMNGVLRVGSHAKLGFGEFRVRPAGEDRVPERDGLQLRPAMATDRRDEPVSGTALGEAAGRAGTGPGASDRADSDGVGR